MQFMVRGYDGNDAQAASRRQAARTAHLALGDELIAAGNLIIAAAILDEQENMVGSILLMDFSSRKELDHWLTREPYVTNNVWQKIEVTPCRLGPAFAIRR